MRWSILVVVAVLGCDSPDRIALDLSGDFPTARQIDLILAAPQAFPRGQRRNG